MKKIFLFISFFIVLALTLFIVDAYKKGAKNTVNFVYGIPHAELQSYIEKAKKGDSEAASSLVYTFSRRDLYSSQLFSDWTWYTMTLQKKSFGFSNDTKRLFIYFLTTEDRPCPNYPKNEMKNHLNYWVSEENEKTILDAIPFLKDKREKDRKSFNRDSIAFIAKCLN